MRVFATWQKEREVKYYYTDPLAAAWMAKKFSMRFENCHLQIGYVEGRDGMHDTCGFLKISSGWDLPNRFYIHSDSLHLLDSKIGDTVRPSSVQQLAYIGGDVLVKNMRGFPNTTFMTMEEITSIKEKYGNVQIIERAHVPFMWPEIENE